MPFLRSLYSNPYVMLTLAPLGWAFNTIAGRLAVGQISPMALTFLRWTLVMLVMIALAHRDLVAERRTLRKHWRLIAGLGIFAFTIFNSLYYVAAYYTSALNIGLIQGAIPALVLVVAYFGRGLRASPDQIIGSAVTLAGIVIIAARGSVASLVALRFNIGDLMMVVACVCWAFYTVGLLHKPAMHPLAFFAALAITAAGTSLPLFIGEVVTGHFVPPTPFGWALVVFVSVVPSLASQMLYVRGVELIGPGRAGLFVNLVPVFVPVLAITLLGERIEPYDILAMAFVLGGIAIAEWRRLRQGGGNPADPEKTGT